MELKYWKVVLRYGHVGNRNEIAVARYIVTPMDVTIVKVHDFVQTMPGVKNDAVLSIKPIDQAKYEIEKANELDNFYMQNLKQAWTDEAV